MSRVLVGVVVVLGGVRASGLLTAPSCRRLLPISRGALSRRCAVRASTAPKGPSDDDGGAGMDGSAANGAGVLVPIDVCEEMQDSYLSYAMSVILARALPDARDGLKPVQRRILFAMHELSLAPTSRYRKCARVVGEVLGKYHPHADTSVYDALVRMAQPFNMRCVRCFLCPFCPSPGVRAGPLTAPARGAARVKLVDGHGNFGSPDPDPAAAMRYTECRLTTLASEGLLSEVKIDSVVPFGDNFDSTEEEPLVLPAKVPLLLINGAMGIAVGMATSIPPHNPGEVLRAAAALVRDEDLPDEKLFAIVTGPDFPTGGEILGSQGIRELYTTGQGIVPIRGKVHQEAVGKSSRSAGSGSSRRPSLVVTELPYGVTKNSFLTKVADLVQAGRLAGVAELRDESDREGMRLVVELRRDAVPELVMNHLFKSTPLQSRFAGNLLALTQDGRQPSRLTLRQALLEFVRFREATILRRAAQERTKSLARLHIVEGLVLALANVDAVVAILRAAESAAAAKAVLCGREGGGEALPAAADTGAPAAAEMSVPRSATEGAASVAGALSDVQADAVLAMPLRRLTTLEVSSLEDERSDLLATVAGLDRLLTDEAYRKDHLVEELESLVDTFDEPRRTQVNQDTGSGELTASGAPARMFPASPPPLSAPLSSFRLHIHPPHPAPFLVAPHQPVSSATLPSEQT